VPCKDNFAEFENIELANLRRAFPETRYGGHAVAVHVALAWFSVIEVDGMGTIWAQFGHDKDFVGLFPVL
jgi:hypothetical protein